MKRIAPSRIVLAAMLLIAAAPVAFANDAPVDFARDVQPILIRNCDRCHGSKKAEGRLTLGRKESVFGEGESGEIIVTPGDPDKSALIARVAGDSAGDRMPLDAPPLAEREIKILRRWIEQGAKWPERTGDEKHWAYRAPVRSPPPEVKNAAWAKNEVDQFVLKSLEDAHLAPEPDADRARLIRRVSLALVGLPPTIEEVDAFVKDDSPDAYEKVVDRLIASPEYGPHWARQWLDLARYADSNGYQADQLRDNWAYRDWVVDALNRDMPFDQFVTWQLAGDLLPDATLEQKIATGFNRTVTCNVEAGVRPEENRVNQVFDRVNTTAAVFLGTTMECAQCHDHKYDPFSQRDYYRLFAYFNNTPLEVKQLLGRSFDFAGPDITLPNAPEKDVALKECREKKSKLEEEQKQIREQELVRFRAWRDERLAALSDEATAACLPEVPKPIQALFAKLGEKKIAAPAVEVASVEAGGADSAAVAKKEPAPAPLTPREQMQLENYFTNLNPEMERLNKELEQLKKELAALAPPTTLVMVEMEKPRETAIFNRGNFTSPGDKVEPGTPEALHALDSTLPKNRLGLAKWIVSPENPLLSRVTVNRWWSEIFGRGLVSSPEDFGTQGEPPSHPELLDWLAAEFAAPADGSQRWSMKHMHKLMVMSATFRQSAGASIEKRKHDPENRLLARGPRFRLAAEAIRDNALAVSGLICSTQGGPPVMPYQPANLWRSVGRNQPTWQTATNDDRFRRGLYVVWKRAAPYPSFTNFDAPDRATCTVERPRTNTPTQALTLLNDPAYAEMAMALAQRMMTESVDGTPTERARRGFRLAAAREPNETELQAMVELYQSEFEALKDQPKLVEDRNGLLLKRLRKPDLDRVELAAWFAVANALLNLDETINL